MKKSLVFALSAFSLLACSAFAADLPSRKGPPILASPAPMWTGFHIGVNAGGIWNNNSTTNFTSWNLKGPLTYYESANSGAVNTGTLSGFLGGGQIGYNLQLMNNFVVGGEADIQGVGAQSSNGASSILIPNSTTISFGTIRPPVTIQNPLFSQTTASNSLSYIGTVRGRIGFLTMPTLLIYGTGGLAYGQINTTVSTFQSVQTENYVAYGSNSISNTVTGWTAGGGGEWLFAPNLSLKVEYLYYDLGNLTQNFLNVCYPCGPDQSVTAESRFNGNIVRAGLNYHFTVGDLGRVAW